jgi:valine--pyruvate aminotransferase
MEFSRFAERFCGSSGVVDLMQDLGDALTIHPDMISMGGGNPGRVPAAVELFRARLLALLGDADRTHALLGAYQSPQGDESFRAAMAAMLRAEYGWQLGPGNIVVSNGSQSAFFVLFNLFAGEFAGGGRRHVHLPLVPEYIGYQGAGLSEGMFHADRPAIELLPDQQFKYRVDFAGLHIDESAGAICVSRPSNPTGNVLGDAEIAQLDLLARERGIPLVIDGAYGVPFPGMVFAPATAHWNDNTVLVLSLSKLGLPGLRTGIIVAREEIALACARANTVLNLACGNVGPALAAELLRGGELLRLVRGQIAPFYRDKAACALDAMQRAIAGLPCRVHRPEGAMFLWLWCAAVPGGAHALYERLKARGVLVVPGREFFPGLAQPWAHSEECIRVSYAQDEARVQQGIAIIGDELRRSYGG